MLKKPETDKEDRILNIDVSVNNAEYIIINLCNANTEKEQINVFSNMFALLKKFDINKTKNKKNRQLWREILIYFLSQN